MPSKTGEKIECLNPNTGNKMNIDAKVYEIFSNAIYHVLMENKQGVTYTEIVKGIKNKGLYSAAQSNGMPSQ